MFHIPRPKDGVYYSDKFNQVVLVEGFYLYYKNMPWVGYLLMFGMDRALTYLKAKWIGEF